MRRKQHPAAVRNPFFSPHDAPGAESLPRSSRRRIEFGYLPFRDCVSLGSHQTEQAAANILRQAINVYCPALAQPDTIPLGPVLKDVRT
jgi:hypothetical protein